MTREEAIATSLAALGATFNRQIDATVADAYSIGLEGLTAAEVSRACAAALRKCKFMPAPSELRALSGRAELRDLKHEAALAWDAVRKAIDRVDYTVALIDFGPHVNAVVRQLGGWDALCTAKLHDLDVWKRKEFERQYEVFAEKEIGDIGAPLEGDWKTGHRVISIAGIPSQPAPKGLPPKDANPDAARRLIRELAEGKAAP